MPVSRPSPGPGPTPGLRLSHGQPRPPLVTAGPGGPAGHGGRTRGRPTRAGVRAACGAGAAGLPWWAVNAAANVSDRASRHRGRDLSGRRAGRILGGACGCWPGGRSAAPPARAACSAPRRRGAVTLRLARAVGRAVVLAARFAAGAPLGRRRTDATFLSRGTRALSAGCRAGSPPASPAGGPSCPAGSAPPSGGPPSRSRSGSGRPAADHRRRARRAGRRRRGGAGPPLAAVAVRAGGGPPGLPAAVRLPRHRPRRQARRWLDVPRGFAANPDAVVTLTYPAAWNPDTARQKNIDEVIRRHLGGDLDRLLRPHSATWRHPPAPPARALFDGYDLPAHRIHLATLRRRPESGSPTWKTRNRTCSSRPAPAAARPPPPPSLPRTSARTAG